LLTGLLFLAVGLPLFALPAQLAPLFAWKVSPFVAMTIGGWSLGNAWLAFFTARRAEWRLVYSSALYLWLFGILELGVLVAFRLKLVLASPIAWGYVAALVACVACAIAGALDWMRVPPASTSSGPTASRIQRISLVLFVIVVGFLGLYGLSAPQGAPATNGGVFPEVMSPFTLRSFGAFYLALALAVVPMLRDRNRSLFLQHAASAFGFIVFITIAAFAHLRLFDFAERPGGLAYIGVYVAVGLVTAYFLLTSRRAAAR
jgi:hypothetical protein